MEMSPLLHMWISRPPQKAIKLYPLSCLCSFRFKTLSFCDNYFAYLLLVFLIVSSKMGPKLHDSELLGKSISEKQGEV